MLNLTIALLIQKNALASSPLLSLSSSLYVSRFINFNQIKYQNFISPIFYSNAQSFNLLLSQSTFSNSIEKVAQVDAIKDKYFTSQQDFKDFFKLEIFDCKFYNIKSSSIPGGAFHAITQLHSLVLSRTSFINCHSNADDLIGKIPFKVSAGAFIFTGAKASVLYSCFSKCTAVGNAKTFFIVTPEHGTINVRSIYFGKNNNNDYKGHYLFSLNKGRCEITSINSSMNNVPEGYAGGAIGSYATTARIGYSIFANNSGNSIFGINTLGLISKSVVRSSAFLSNKATKYGVYMRLTGPSRLEDVTFSSNQGNCFYGSSPITFSRCVCDCDKPVGLIEDESCQWNRPVMKARHYYKVPGSCNLTEYKNIVRRRPDLKLPPRNQGIMSRNSSYRYNDNTAHDQFNLNYRRNNPFSRYHTNPNYNRRQNYNENGNQNFRNERTNSNFNTNRNSNTDSKPESEFNSRSNTNSETRSNSRYRSESGINTNSETRSNSRYRSEPESNTNSETRSNSRYRSESGTNTNSETRSNSRYRSEPESNTNSETRSNSRYRSESGTSTNSETRSNSRYRSEPESNSNSETRSNSRYRSESGTNTNSERSNSRYRSEQDSNSNSETRSNSRYRSESRANSNSQTGTQTNSNSSSDSENSSKPSMKNNSGSSSDLDSQSNHNLKNENSNVDDNNNNNISKNTKN